MPSRGVGDQETDSLRTVVRAASSKAWPRGGSGADPEKQRTLALGRWVCRQSHAATAPTGEPETSGGERAWRALPSPGRGAEASCGEGADYKAGVQAAGDLRRRVQIPRAVARDVRAGTTAATTQAAPANSTLRPTLAQPRTFRPRRCPR